MGRKQEGLVQWIYPLAYPAHIPVVFWRKFQKSQICHLNSVPFWSRWNGSGFFKNANASNSLCNIYPLHALSKSTYCELLILLQKLWHLTLMSIFWLLAKFLWVLNTCWSLGVLSATCRSRSQFEGLSWIVLNCLPLSRFRTLDFHCPHSCTMQSFH